MQLNWSFSCSSYSSYYSTSLFQFLCHTYHNYPNYESIINIMSTHILLLLFSNGPRSDLVICERFCSFKEHRGNLFFFFHPITLAFWLSYQNQFFKVNFNINNLISQLKNIPLFCIFISKDSYNYLIIVNYELRRRKTTGCRL